MGNEETDVGLEINEFNEHDEFCLKSYEETDDRIRARRLLFESSSHNRTTPN